jgi:hypothetical protein
MSRHHAATTATIAITVIDLKLSKPNHAEWHLDLDEN